MIRIILTQYQKVKDQIDTFKMSMTKLKNSLKDRDQICHLLKKFLWSKISLFNINCKSFFYLFFLFLWDLFFSFLRIKDIMRLFMIFNYKIFIFYYF